MRMRFDRGARVRVRTRDGLVAGTVRYPDQANGTYVVDTDDGTTRRVHYTAVAREAA